MGTANEQISVAKAVAQTIAARGARRVFGVVGSGNFRITNALVDAGLVFTAARHEMGAVCMADGHSRLSRQVSVVSLHQGGGLTNALTGITEAAKAHTPVLVVSADTAEGAVTDTFYIDQDAAIAAVGAVPARVRSAATAVGDVVKAFDTATMDRTTVVLSVPVDIQTHLVRFRNGMIPPIPEYPLVTPLQRTVEEMVDVLEGASRPVIVAGRGALGAGAELRRLAELSGALLVTSAAARGLFTHDEWALDVMGGFATEGAAELIAEADVLVAFGASLNRFTTRSGSLLENSTVVQVDDRAEAIGSHQAVDLGVVGDAAVVATTLSSILAGRNPAGRVAYRTPEVRRRIDEVRYWKDQPVTARMDEARVDPRELINALDHILPEQRVVLTDGGNVNCYAGAHLRVPDQWGYCLPLCFQAIGLGVPTAIGAGLALPERLPVLGTGDGAFMMSPGELDTAVRLHLGMVVIVFNDNAYGAEVNIFGGETDRLDTVQFPDTDIAAVARGYGCDAVTVRAMADLRHVQAWLAGPRERPLVIDAKIAPHMSWLMARGRDSSAHRSAPP